MDGNFLSLPLLRLYSGIMCLWRLYFGLDVPVKQKRCVEPFIDCYNRCIGLFYPVHMRSLMKNPSDMFIGLIGT